MGGACASSSSCSKQHQLDPPISTRNALLVDAPLQFFVHECMGYNKVFTPHQGLRQTSPTHCCPCHTLRAQRFCHTHLPDSYSYPPSLFLLHHPCPTHTLPVLPDPGPHLVALLVRYATTWPHDTYRASKEGKWSQGAGSCWLSGTQNGCDDPHHGLVSLLPIN